MATSTDALIVFVKNSIPGKVKTRLARTLGDDRAIEVYHELQEQTEQVTRFLQVNKYVYYSDSIPAKLSLWPEAWYQHRVQQGADLGERMKNAFDEVFSEGYKRICLIGSDCPYLSQDILRKAFNRLSETEVVIGPSRDGGYYLLGLTRPHGELFTDVMWGGNEIFDATILKFIALGMIWYELPILEDIDTAADLERYRLYLRQHEFRNYVT